MNRFFLIALLTVLGAWSMEHPLKKLVGRQYVADQHPGKCLSEFRECQDTEGRLIASCVAVYLGSNPEVGRPLFVQVMAVYKGKKNEGGKVVDIRRCQISTDGKNLTMVDSGHLRTLAQEKVDTLGTDHQEQ